MAGASEPMLTCVMSVTCAVERMGESAQSDDRWRDKKGDTHVLGDRVVKVERDEVAGKGVKVSSGRVAEDAQGERDGPSNRS